MRRCPRSDSLYERTTSPPPVAILATASATASSPSSSRYSAWLRTFLQALALRGSRRAAHARSCPRRCPLVPLRCESKSSLTHSTVFLLRTGVLADSGFFFQSTIRTTLGRALGMPHVVNEHIDLHKSHLSSSHTTSLSLRLSLSYAAGSARFPSHRTSLSCCHTIVKDYVLPCPGREGPDTFPERDADGSGVWKI